MTQDTNGDRELLELAARAASQPGAWIQNEYEGWGFWQHPGGGEWNPITDDGDALRLSVKLGISIQHSATIDTQEPNIETFDSEDRFGGWFDEVKGDDPYAAARRAIVRAAAEIGRGIPQPTAEGLPEDNYYKAQAEAEEYGRSVAKNDPRLGKGAA